jgi:E3 ubiquitin-protein ligase HUWE1
LADLLLTTDLDVLLSTIILLLRPTQQYGTGIPVEGELGTRLANRVLTLTRGWEQFQEAGLDAVQLASLETVTASSTKVNLQYYPEEGSRSSISSLELDSSELETPDQIAEVAERHRIPVDDQLTLLHRARILTTLQNRSTRRTLLAIRFLAVATYVYIVSEEVSMSTIFLYETSVIQQLANVMVPNRDVGDWVLSSALYALDACAHHRVKLQEVLTTVGANVSHGILIRFFRDLVTRLTGGGDPTKAEDILFEVLDAIIGLIAYVATSPPHNNHVVSAGVIPLLLEMPKTLVPRRENVSIITPGVTGFPWLIISTFHELWVF